MKHLDTRLTLEGAGRFRISKRGKEWKSGEFTTYDAIDLVEADVDEMCFDVRTDEGSANFCVLNLNDHHVENPETGEFYHASLEIRLGEDELERLVEFLQFVRANGFGSV